MARLAIRPLIVITRSPTSTTLSCASTHSRSFATEAKFDPSTIERASDDVDICIVGGGPAGLSAAIRIKQLEKEKGGEELRVVVLEKGGEVGQ